MADDNALTPDQTVENPTSEQELNGTNPSTEVQYLTAAEAERLWEAREAKLRQEMDARIADQQRKAQSKYDSARDTAIRKSKDFIKEYAPILKEAGIDLDTETIDKVSNRIREKEFWQEPTPPAPPANPQDERTPVTAQALQNYMRSRGLSPDAFDIKEFYVNPDGTPVYDNDPRGNTFYSKVDAAVEASKEALKQKALAEKAAAAQKVVGVRNNYGGTSTPSGSPGGSVNPNNLEQELQTLLKKQPADQVERNQIRKRMDEIEKELRSLKRWGNQT